MLWVSITPTLYEYCSEIRQSHVCVTAQLDGPQHWNLHCDRIVLLPPPNVAEHRSLLVVYCSSYYYCLSNYLSEWSPMERRAPAQRFVTRPVYLRSLRTGMTRIPFLLVLYVFIALVYFTTVNLIHKSTHYRVVCNAFVCRALHALGRAAPTLGAPQSLGWAAPRFCWFSWVRRAHWAAA